jgi:hypothetical protein
LFDIIFPIILFIVQITNHAAPVSIEKFISYPDQPVFDGTTAPWNITCIMSASHLKTIAWKLNGSIVNENIFRIITSDTACPEGRCAYDVHQAIRSELTWNVLQQTNITCNTIAAYNGDYTCTGYGVAAGVNKENSTLPMKISVQREFIDLFRDRSIIF